MGFFGIFIGIFFVGGVWGDRDGFEDSRRFFGRILTDSSMELWRILMRRDHRAEIPAILLGFFGIFDAGEAYTRPALIASEFSEYALGFLMILKDARQSVKMKSDCTHGPNRFWWIKVKLASAGGSGWPIGCCGFRLLLLLLLMLMFENLLLLLMLENLLLLLLLMLENLLLLFGLWQWPNCNSNSSSDSALKKFILFLCFMTFPVIIE